MRALLAAALLAAPAGAASDTDGLTVVEYTTDVDSPSLLSSDPVVSADGYHFTTVDIDKDAESVYLDAKKIAQGPLGTFTYEEKGSLRSGRQFLAALSRDGRVSAHAMLARDDEGRPGYRLAVNGAPVGRRFPLILEIGMSPGGSNVAFVAQASDGKYLVVSAEGAGPSVGSPEKLVGVADSGVAYTLNFGGRNWVYRNHKALTYNEYISVAATPDLSHIAGATFGGVEVDGKPLGRWHTPRALRYSRKGELIFLARSSPNIPDAQADLVVVNGQETALPPFKPNNLPPFVRPDGASFIIEDSGTYGILRIGGRAMPELGGIMPAAEWVAFSPSGAHWAVVAKRGKTYELVVDGKLFASAPSPLRTGRIVFDSETELHYLADSMTRIALVCASIGGEASPRSACIRHGEAIGKKDRYKLKPRGADSPAPR